MIQLTEALNPRILEKLKEIEMEDEIAEFLQEMLFFELKQFGSSTKRFSDKYDLEIKKFIAKRKQGEKIDNRTNKD